MLRSFLIYMSKAAWARQLITKWSFAWRTASRFIAGERLEDALQVVKLLNKNGFNTTLDHLGENTTSVNEANQAAQSILEIIDFIDKYDLRSNVSIKLSQIGLKLSEELCESNLGRILRYASEKSNFVRVDMEDSPYVDATLKIVNRLRETYDLTNTGVVIQSYLYRSENDIRSLQENNVPVRLCKGAYKEPLDIAFPQKRDVDENYDRLAEILLQSSILAGNPPISSDGKKPPITALATHDPKRIEIAKDIAAKLEVPKDALEFQMLFGIRRDLQESIMKEGYPVRIYVPFGMEWYPYFVRRLAERPANLWFFISNLIRR